MGISNSWFAVQGWSRDEALSELGLTVHREIGSQWPARELAVGQLPDGWLLFVLPGLEGAFQGRFVALSRRGPGVACAIEEHVMYQEARGYQHGAEAWRVVHDTAKGKSLYHLEVSGSPPAVLGGIHQAALAEQDAAGGENAGVDFVSDVPLLLGKSICGFKHDDEWPDGLSFWSLEGDSSRPRSQNSGFFQRLFGRR